MQSNSTNDEPNLNQNYPHVDEDVSYFDDDNNLNDNEGPTSSIENIIPPQLQQGFNAFSIWMTKSALTIQAKAVEISQSEMVQDLQRRTSETANLTIAAATPYVEKTREVMADVAHKTVETTSTYVEQMKPTIEEASVKMAEAVTTGWNQLSQATKELSQQMSSNSNTRDTTSSASTSPSSFAV